MNYLVSFGKPKPSIKVHSNQEVAKTSFAAASSTQPFPLSLRASESILKRFDSLECRPQPQSRRASSNSSVYQLAQARRYSIDEAEGIAAEIMNGYSPPGPSVSLPEVVKERKPLSISAAIVQRRASERALSLGMSPRTINDGLTPNYRMRASERVTSSAPSIPLRQKPVCRYSKNLEKYHVLRDYQVSPSSLPPKRRESVTFAEDVCFANCTNLSGGVPRRRRSESVTAAGTAPSSSSLSGMSCTRRASESQLVDAMSSRRVRFATISELAIVERPAPEEITNKWYRVKKNLAFTDASPPTEKRWPSPLLLYRLIRDQKICCMNALDWRPLSPQILLIVGSVSVNIESPFYQGRAHVLMRSYLNWPKRAVNGPLKEQQTLLNRTSSLVHEQELQRCM